MSRIGQFVQDQQEAHDADAWAIEQYEQRCEYLEEQQCNLNKEKITDNKNTSVQIPETTETAF